MKITVENGWRGPIEGVAKLAALTRAGDVVTIAIPRWAAIVIPKVGAMIPWEEGCLTVEEVSATRSDITIVSRRTASD